MSPERGGAGSGEPPGPSWQPPAPAAGLGRPLPLPAQAPVPPSPPSRRRRGAGRLALAALLSAALAVTLGLTAAHLYTARSSPESVVRGFFQALAAGDAPSALALAESPPQGPWLTSEVLRRQLQVASLADISVLDASRLGSTATVQVRYRLLFGSGSRAVTDTARLIRRGSSWWLSQVGTTVRVSASGPSAERVRLAGQPLPTAAVTLFPGALPLTADPPGLQVLVTAPAPGAGAAVRLADPQLVAMTRVSITPALRAQAEQAVQQLLAGCLAARSNDPLCPAPDSGRPVPGSLHGSAAPVAALNSQIVLEQGVPGVISVRARVAVQGSWKVWDFENQLVQQRGTATVTLSAQVAVDRPTVAFWSRPE